MNILRINHSVSSIFLLVGLFSSFTYAEFSSAADTDKQAVDTLPIEYIVPKPCSGNDYSQLRWYDRTHQFISAGACKPSQWFDRFFGGQVDPDTQGSTLVRVTSSWQWDRKNLGEFSTRYRARAYLPNTKKRLKLIFADDDDTPDDNVSLDAERPEDAKANAENNRFSGALRWVMDKSDAYDADLDVGLNSSIKTFVKLRYRKTIGLNNDQLLHLTQRFFWRDTRGFGERTVVAWDKVLTPTTLFRWANSLEYSLETKKSYESTGQGGWFEWYESASLSHKLSKKKAVVFNVGAYGVLRVNAIVSGYNVSARYRQNIFRPWLFYEIQPFLDFPRADNYKSTDGIAIRLEYLFGTKSK